MISNSLLCAVKVHVQDYIHLCSKYFSPYHFFLIPALLKCRNHCSKTILSYVIQPIRHHFSQGEEKQRCALTPLKPLLLGKFIACIKPRTPTSSISFLTTRLPHKRVTSLPVSASKPRFSRHSVRKLIHSVCRQRSLNAGLLNPNLPWLQLSSKLPSTAMAERSK